MHEIITTSLHSRKILTVPTDWDDDVSEIATACSQTNKFSPLKALRRRKQESPRNFQIVRPAEEAELGIFDEEREYSELESNFFWEKPLENIEVREPVVELQKQLTCSKIKLQDKSRGTLFSSLGRSPQESVVIEHGRRNYKRRPEKRAAKFVARSSREEESECAVGDTSILVEQRRNYTRRDAVGSDMQAHIRKESTLQESNCVGRDVFHKDNFFPTYSFTRQTHGVEMPCGRLSESRQLCETTKWVSAARCHKDIGNSRLESKGGSNVAQDEWKTKPSVSAAIVLRESGWPGMDWFKTREMVIPVQSATMVDESAKFFHHDPHSPERTKERQSELDAQNAATNGSSELESIVLQKDEIVDPFNELCLNIWSSACFAGTELLSTTSEVCSSVGLPAMQSLQHVVFENLWLDGCIRTQSIAEETEAEQKSNRNKNRDAVAITVLDFQNSTRTNPEDAPRFFP